MIKEILLKVLKAGFKFEINIEEGEGDFYLFSIGRNFDDQNSYSVLFLDKDTINISAEVQIF
jgi:hypothetical protein